MRRSNGFKKPRPGFEQGFLFRHPILPEAELRELIRRAQAGDIDARNEAVRCNLRLVLMRAKAYPFRPGFGWDETIAAGAEGLMAAVATFDLERTTGGKPIKFSTHANWRIYAAMRRADSATRGIVFVPEYTTWPATQRRNRAAASLGAAATAARNPVREGDPSPFDAGLAFCLNDLPARTTGSEAEDAHLSRLVENLNGWLARLKRQEVAVLAKRYRIDVRSIFPGRINSGLSRADDDRVAREALAKLRLFAAEAGIGGAA